MNSKFNLVTISSLNEMAKKYNTSIASYLSDYLKIVNTNNYSIPNGSKEEFNNICNFLFNATIKDSTDINKSETELSQIFGDILLHYFQEGISNSEIIQTIRLFTAYNNQITEYLNKYCYSIIFEKNSTSDEAYFNKLKNKLITYYNNIIYAYNDTEHSASNLYGSAQAELSNFIELLVSFYILKKIQADTNIENKIALSYEKINNVNYGDSTILKYDEETGSPYYYIPEGSDLDTNYQFFNFSETRNILRIKFCNPIVEHAGTAEENIFNEEIFHIDLMLSKNVYTVVDSVEGQTYDTNLYIKENNEFDGNSNKHVEVIESLFYNDTLTEETLINMIQSIPQSIDIKIDENIKNSFIDLLMPNEYMSIHLKKSKFLYRYKSVTPDKKKNSASLSETLNMNNYQLLTMFDIQNIQMSETEYNSIIAIDPLAESGFNKIYNTDETKTIYYFSFKMLYKELNLFYRKIEYADYIEFILASLGSTILFESDNLYTHVISFNNTKLFSNEVMSLISALKVHPYYCRRAKESEIIQYFQGAFADYSYGTTTIEKKQIAKFLNIYYQTREYYYRNLLNKSFILDTAYKVYEKMFISFYSIERFLSYKLDELNNINYFDEEDIKNFLSSYGLDKLNDITGFNKEVDYKKRIIANYITLMQSRGSRQAITKLQNIFNDLIYTININRYVLVKKTSFDTETHEETNKLVFVEIPYDTTNEMKIINEKLKSGEYTEYNNFISSDNYWKVNSDTLLPKIDSIPTKYNSFELSENIFLNFIKSRYCLAAMDAIEKKLSKEYRGDETPNTFDILIENDLITAAGVSNSLTIYQYYRAIRDVYDLYLYKQAIQDDSDINNYVLTANSIAARNYGINLDPLLFISGENDSDVKKFIINELAIYETDMNNITITDEYSYDTTTGNVLTSSDFEEIYSSIKAKQRDLMETRLAEQTSENYAHGLQSVDLVLEYLDSLTLIKLLSAIDDNTYDDNKYKNIIKFYKYLCGKNNAGENISNILSDTDNSGDFSNILLYNYFLKLLLEIPLAYNDGILSQDYLGESLYRNKFFVDFIEEIYKNIYSVNTSDYAYLCLGTEDTTTGVDSYIENKDTSEGAFLYYCFTGSKLNKTDTTKLLHTFITTNLNDISLENVELLLTAMTKELDALTNSIENIIFDFSIAENTENAAAFIITVIKQFISYTTEIYKTKIYKTYNTDKETIPFAENIHHNIVSNKIDMFYYDESLEIGEENT